MRAIHKELRMKQFSPDVWRCFTCGNDDHEALKHCGKCKHVWFCDKRCLQKGWPVHKKNCASLAGRGDIQTCMPTSCRKQVEGDIARDGFCILSHRTGPSVLLRDDATGELFESLTNQTAFFMDAVAPRASPPRNQRQNARGPAETSGSHVGFQQPQI